MGLEFSKLRWQHTDLGPTDACGSVFKVYNSIGIGGTCFGMELYGPVLCHILTWTRTEGYGRRRLFPRVLPHQAATTTSGKWKNVEKGEERITEKETPFTYILLFFFTLLRFKKKSMCGLYKVFQNQGSVVGYNSQAPDRPPPVRLLFLPFSCLPPFTSLLFTSLCP